LVIYLNSDHTIYRKSTLVTVFPNMETSNERLIPLKRMILFHYLNCEGTIL